MRHSPSWRSVAAAVGRVATPAGREQVGCFAIEGLRLHERALRAGASLESVLVSDALVAEPSERAQRLLADLGRACPVHVAPQQELLRLVDGRKSADPVGLVRLPPLSTLEQVRSGRSEGRDVLLVADGIEDPGNVGALVRTALASGAAGWVGVGISDPYHPKAVRTSMGSLFKLPIVRYSGSALLLSDLDRLGYRKVGAVSREGGSLNDVRFGGEPLALFLGSEAFGLLPRVLSAMDLLVSVPMVDEVDSLSVNAAAAVLLYEIRRQTLSSAR